MKGVELFVVVLVVAAALGAVGYMLAPSGPTGLQTFNNPPTALAQTVLAESLPLTINLDEFFFDAEGDTLTYLADDAFVVIAGNTLTFNPSSPASEYTITLTVSDGTNTIAKPFTFIFSSDELQADSPAPIASAQEVRGSLQEQPLQQPSSSSPDTEITRDISSERTISAACGDCTGCSTCASTPGNTCTLSAHIDSTDTCITVSAAGVTIECAGFNITYASTTDNSYGIDTSGASNTLITGCNITQTSATFQASPAINLGTSNGGFQVFNSRIITPGTGISGTSVTSLLVQNTSFNLSSGASGFLTSGIDVTGTNIIIRNNSFSATGNGLGIESFGSTLVNISNNTFSITGTTPGNALELNINHSNVSGNRMVATTSNSNFNGQNVTVTDNRFRSLNWVTGTNFTWRNNRASSTGEHVFDPRTGNASSMNDTFTGRLVLRTINFTMHNSTFNSTSIGVLRVAGINITIENATARASGGIHLIGVNGSGHILSNITIQATATPLLNLTNTTNSTFTNLNLSTTSTWMSFIGTITDNRFFNINMSTSNGSIYYPEFNVSATGILNRTNVTITLNRTFVNTTGLPFLNQSAQIQLRNLTFTDPLILIDTDDDGVYATCSEPDCTEVSYNGSTLLFNVSHFTSHAVSEGANTHPSIAQVILNNSNGAGYNLNLSNTSSDLNVFVINAIDADNDSIQNITDWRVNGTSFAVLNLPFETNISSNTVDALRDYSTFGNNGTLGNGTASAVPAWNSSGKVGGAYTFDGSNDFIDCGVSGIPSSPPITLEAWALFNQDQGATDYDYVMQASAFDGTDLFNIAREAATNNVYYFGGGALRTGPVLPTGSWNHVVMVFRSSAPFVRFYLNGTSQTIAQPGAAVTPTGAFCTVGAFDGTTHLMNGTIDGVKIYNRELSADQIYQNYLDGNRSIHVETLHFNETGTSDNWSVAVTPNDNQNASDGTTVLSNNVTILADPLFTGTPTLNSSQGGNTSPENLTANLTVTSGVKTFTNWYLSDANTNNKSLFLVNMPMDGGALAGSQVKDYSPNANHANIVGATYSSTGGYDGKGAYTFDGSADTLTFPANITFGHQDNWTITFWAQKSADGNNGGTVGKQNTGSVTDTIWLLNGVVEFRNTTVGTNGAEWQFVFDANTTLNHYAFVANNHRLEMYLNGTFHSAIDSGTGFTLDGIGKFNSASFDFAGTADELTIWNTSLTPSQVRKVYEGNTTLFHSAMTRVGDTLLSQVTPNNNILDDIAQYSNNLTIGTGDIFGRNQTYLNSSSETNTSVENLTINVTYVTNVSQVYSYYRNGSPILAAYYTFNTEEDVVRDYSGNDRNGSRRRLVVWQPTSGFDGRGIMNFAGSDDSLTIPEMTWNPRQPWSVSFWAQKDVDTAQGNVMGTRDDAASTLWLTASTLEFRNTTDALGGTAFSWDANTSRNFYTLVAPGSERLELYVNGTFFDALDVGTGFTINDVGDSASSFSFDGTIDDVSIWNTTLTPSQIRALFNNRSDVIVNSMTGVSDTWQLRATPNDNFSDGNTTVLSMTVLDGDTFGFGGAILNASPNTDTTSNLTANFSYTANVDRNVVWYVNGSPSQLLNAPFDSEAYPSRDYAANQSYARFGDAVWEPTAGIDGRGQLHFDGSNDYLSVPQFSLRGTQPWTLTVWAKKDVDGSNGGFVGTTNGVTDFISIRSTDVEFRNSTVSGGGPTFAFDANTSQHFYAFRAGGNGSLELFVNGTRIGAVTMGTNFTINNIGAAVAGTAEDFDGTLDEFALWNRSLSQEQIQALYLSNNTLLVSQETQLGDSWQACAVPTDGIDDGQVRCTNAVTIADVNTHPTIAQVILNSTDGSGETGNNSSTSENLTVFVINATDADGDSVQNITDWRVNGTSIAVLNMPFETNRSDFGYLVRDYSTLGNNATLGNASVNTNASWNFSGKVGGGYTFDGVNDLIDLGDVTFLDGATATSYGGWIRPNAHVTNGDGASVRSVIAKADYLGAGNITIAAFFGGTNQSTGLGPAAFNCFVDTPSAFTAFTDASQTNLPIGVWTHFMCTWSSGQSIKLYLNGSLVASSSSNVQSDGLNNVPSSLLIGWSNYSSEDGFSGSIDELVIFNRSLSADQIYQLYLDGNSSHHMETLHFNETAVGDVWSVAVTPNDNQNASDGTTVLSNNVTIQDTGCSLLTFSTNQTISTNQTCDNIVVNTGVHLLINNSLAGNVSIGFFATNFTLQTGAVMNATGTGYTGGAVNIIGNGPGGGAADGTTAGAGGGAHGGFGGNSGGGRLGGAPYGSSLDPITSGSGGGGSGGGAGTPGANGGGAIAIIAQVVNISGALTANANNAASGVPQISAGSGGGAGGSINIVSDQFVGSGTITANGGRGGDASPSNPTGGGGGSGGHIIARFNTTTFDITQASVNAGSFGTGASTNGTAGQVGTLAFINTNQTQLAIRQGWRWQSTDATLWNYSVINLSEAYTRVNGSTLFLTTQTVITQDSSIIGERAIYNFSVNGTTFWLNNTNITNASISNLSVQNVMIASGSLNSTGSGFAGGAAAATGSGLGGGAGSALTGGGGGGHAGIGGLSGGADAGGNPYGSSMTPVTLGSGGGGAGGGAGTSGAGGGGAIFIVSNVTSINGSLIASGANGASGVPQISSGPGGGSGGTIAITTNIISGSGTLFANGGAGGIASGSNPRGGGGGSGGRILIQFNTSTLPITLARVTQGQGGFGATANGSAGQPGSLGFVNLTGNTLLLREGWRWQPNDRATWTFTTINITDAFTRVNDSSLNISTTNLELWNSSIVGERAIFNLSANATILLFNASNVTNGSTVNISAVNATISSASTLSGAGAGFTGGAVNTQGSGAGGGSADGTTNGAGGGAHGGIGGNSGGARPGGSPYGSSLAPATLGSGGGGSGGGAGTVGAPGGGFITVIANRLVVDGALNVSGYDALSGVPQTSAGSGGGAAGSLVILTDVLSGTGTLSARGGRGGDASGSNPRGGGGGSGGRILATFNTSTFPITQASVAGGSFGTGASANGTAGQPGTIGFLNLTGDALTIRDGWRWQPDDRAIWNFTLINITDAFTRVNGSSVNFSSPRVEFFNSSIAGERSVIFNATFNVTNLTLNSSNLTHGSVLNVTVQDAYFLSAVINSTGTGFTGGGPNVAGLGPGGGGAPGGVAGAGGAGHGGRGGASGGSSTVGGAIYGTSLNAATRGSGGGGSGGGAGGTGGNGGGSLNIFAQRLVLNGTLSVNGAPGQDGAAVSASGAGGGSAGAITITTDPLEGNASLSSIGGEGGDGSGSNPTGGGGGGGGRIIVRFNTSTLQITPASVAGGTRGEGPTSPGSAGEVGTLAFLDTNDGLLTIKDGWRWQEEDQPLSFTNVTVLTNTHVRSNGSFVNVSNSFISNQSNWTVEDRSTVLNTSRLYFENGIINSTVLSGRLGLSYAAAFSDANATYLSGSHITLSNVSVAELNWTDFSANVSNLSEHTLLQNNLVRANSTAMPGLNRSANITLYGINVPDPFPLFDGEDDGTFIACPSSRCTEISYTAGAFVFNVSGFTSYSSSGGVTLTKDDSPDPVTAGQTLTYALLINNTNGNITNATVVETYPAEVTFNGSQPTPNSSNNTFIIGDIAANATFQINITVNVSTAVANGTVINNTANLTFNNLSGTSFFVNVTENTTVLAATCPLDITTNTTLADNIACPATAINILSGNLTLDCAGYNVSYGASTIGVGVNISGFSNVTIRNCNIIQNSAANSGSGIISSSASNNNIIGNNISVSHLFSSGITISTGNNHTVANNNITANGTGTLNGITLGSVTNSTVANNTARIPGNTSSTNGAFGVTTSNGIVFINNSGISNNSQGILFTNTVNSTLINNSGFSSDNQGLLFFESTAGREQNNTIINSTGASTTGIGLSLQSGANNNTVIGSSGTSVTSIGIWLRSERNILNTSTGTSTSNIGIRVDGTANVVDYSTGSGATGISLQASGTNAVLNLTNSNGSTTSGNGILLAANYANISNVTGTATSGFGIQISGSNSRNNSIRNSTFLSNTGQALRLDGASAINNSIVNTTLRTNATWIGFFAFPSDNHFENTLFDSTNGSILIIPQVTPAVPTFVFNIGTAQLNTTFNQSFLSSTNITEFNTTAQITLRGLSFTDPRPRVDFEDDGTFTDCNPPQCDEVSYTGGEYVFNVSSFTSYAASESPQCPLNITTSTTLTENVTCPATAINVLADNLALNCAGNTVIYASNATGYGINATGRTNVSIRNCNILQGNSSITGTIALFFDTVTSSTVLNTTANATGNSSAAIHLTGSSLNTIANTSAYAQALTAAAFRIQSSSNTNRIEDSVGFSGAQSGISIATSTNNDVIRSNFTTFSGGAVELSSASGNRFDTIIANDTNGTLGGAVLNFATGTNNNLSNLVLDEALGLGAIRAVSTSTGNTMTNVTLYTDGNWIAASADSTGNTINQTTFERPDGRAYFYSNTTITPGTTATLTNVNISLNRTRINSTTLPYLNTTAQLTFRGIAFTDPRPRVDFEDDGTFADCNSPQCIEVSYAGGEYVFNVSSFTSYAAQENLIFIINLSADKIDSPDPVARGSQLSYQIVLNNTGNASALNVTVNESYPLGVVFDSAQPTPAGNSTFTVGDIANGTSFVINITVNVSNAIANGSVLNNTINISFANSSGEVSQFSDSELTTVLGAPVLVSIKSDTPDPVVRGTQLNYSILLNNTGDDTAFNVTLSETYPAGVSFVTSQPAPTLGNNTFSIGTLAPNETFLVNITVTVGSNLANGTTLNNSVNASWRNSTGQQGTVSDSELTSVLGTANVSVTKSDSPDPVNNGSTLSYTITITNTGDETAYNVTAVDGYDVNITFNGSSPAPTLGNNTFSLGNLLPGLSTTINITVNVSSTMTSGVLNNTVNVTFTNVSGVNTTTSAFQSTTVTTPAVPAAPSAGGGGGGSNFFRTANVTREQPVQTPPLSFPTVLPQTTPPAQAQQPPAQEEQTPAPMPVAASPPEQTAVSGQSTTQDTEWRASSLLATRLPVIILALAIFAAVILTTTFLLRTRTTPVQAARAESKRSMKVQEQTRPAKSTKPIKTPKSAVKAAPTPKVKLATAHDLKKLNSDVAAINKMLREFDKKLKR